MNTHKPTRPAYLRPHASVLPVRAEGAFAASSVVTDNAPFDKFDENIIYEETFE